MAAQRAEISHSGQRTLAWIAALMARFTYLYLALPSVLLTTMAEVFTMASI